MNHKIVVHKDNPFVHDLFNRNEQIVNLYNLITNSSEGFVSCINSPYGLGKTTFFKMLECYINNMRDKDNENIYCIYYDAWENDFFDDPLISLVGTFQESLNESYKINLKNISDTFGIIATRIASNMTNGVFDYNEIREELEKDDKRFLLTSYYEVKKNREIIRKELASLSDKLGPNTKMIFVIDELDRCKPTFSLKLLETIKHYFEMENYYFILSMDKKQMGSTVKKYYGDDIDDTGYLRRFIDFDIEMSPINEDEYIKRLFSSYKKQFFRIENEILEYMALMALRVFCSNIELSLRDIDKIFYYLKIISPFDVFEEENSFKDKEFYNFLNIKESFEMTTIILLVVLKVKNEELYKRVVNQSLKEGDAEYIEDLCSSPHKYIDISVNYYINFFEEYTNAFLKVYSFINKKLPQKHLGIKLFVGNTTSLPIQSLLDQYNKVKLKSFEKAQLISSIEK